MSSTGRAFVAVVPPPEVLDAVGAAMEPIRRTVPGARWTTRGQWHVTLQFLGNHVDLDAAAGALHALDVTSGPARLGGGGAFPSARRGRVLWVGLAEGAELVMRLAERVGALLAPLGYEADARPYHPHLTLARIQPPVEVSEAVRSVDGASLGPAWPVTDVVLFQSHTRSTGAEYEPFARIRVAPEDRGVAPVG